MTWFMPRDCVPASLATTQDLYSLFRFLRNEPWSQLLWWRRVIADPYESGDARALNTLQVRHGHVDVVSGVVSLSCCVSPAAWERLLEMHGVVWLRVTSQCVLRPLLLRRTKDLVDEDGKAIVSLPPRHVKIVEVQLSEAERKFYAALFSRRCGHCVGMHCASRYDHCDVFG